MVISDWAEQGQLVGQREGHLEVRLPSPRAHQQNVCSAEPQGSPQRLTRTCSVESMVSEFVTLYNSTWGSRPFTNLTELAANLGWTATINQSTMAYFDAQGINARWTREMVEGATRVNYGQVP